MIEESLKFKTYVIQFFFFLIKYIEKILRLNDFIQFKFISLLNYSIKLLIIAGEMGVI